MNQTRQHAESSGAYARPVRVGAVSFLNTRPLIEGLADDARIELVYGVPARLAEQLASRQLDVALIPVVDYACSPEPLAILSDACIAADGETLTVRIFSRVPPDRIDTLHVDGDSHTSVALARLLAARVYRRPIDIRPLARDAALTEHQAVLLIGDKVVSAQVEAFDYDVDLGGAWKAWTGLPFVFAVWATRTPDAYAWVADALSAARDRGVAVSPWIAERDGPELGWPVPAAVDYLTNKLSFTLGPRFRRGMELFLQSVAEHGIVAARNNTLAATP